MWGVWLGGGSGQVGMGYSWVGGLARWVGRGSGQVGREYIWVGGGGYIPKCEQMHT